MQPHPIELGDPRRWLKHRPVAKAAQIAVDLLGRGKPLVERIDHDHRELEWRHGKRVDRLLLCWTSEARRADAIMEFAYRPELKVIDIFGNDTSQAHTVEVKT